MTSTLLISPHGRVDILPPSTLADDALGVLALWWYMHSNNTKHTSCKSTSTGSFVQKPVVLL